MSTKRLTSRERKREILDVTLKIIHNEGYSNLSIRNISKNINISEAAIYRHFKSKEELLEELIKWVYSEIEVFNMDDYKKEPSFELLNDIILNLLKKLEHNPEFTSVLFQEEIFREYPEMKKMFDIHRRETKDNIIRIIYRGQLNGNFAPDSDLDSFALVFMGSIRIAVLTWRSNNFNNSLQNTGKKVSRELFKILDRKN